MKVAPIRAEDVTVPRSSLEEAWMDVSAASFEVRRDLGRAYQALERGTDLLDHLLTADRRLIRLTEYARRLSGEAAGITYISPDQLPLFEV